MRVVNETSGRIRYRRCHVLAPLNDYPALDVRLTYEDFAALYEAFDHPGIRNWCMKMMTLFPEATDAEKDEGEEAQVAGEPATQDKRKF